MIATQLPHTHSHARHASDYSQTPLNIYWEMTLACGLACRHCRAEAVPTAHPEEMTFGEQMIHIAVSNVFRFNQITGIKTPFPVDLDHPPAADKQTVLKVLDQSFDYVIDVLPQITNEELKRTWHIPSWKGRTDPDGRAMIVNMFVHTAHHRAQCDVYLRAKGIKPPDYTF